MIELSKGERVLPHEERKVVKENVINAFQVAAIGNGESGQNQGEELVLPPRTQQEAADRGAEDASMSEP